MSPSPFTHDMRISYAERWLTEWAIRGLERCGYRRTRGMDVNAAGFHQWMRLRVVYPK